MSHPEDPIQTVIRTLLKIAAEHPDRLIDIAATVADELTKPKCRTWDTGDEIPLDVALVHEPETGVVWDRCTEGPALSDRIWQTAVEERCILQRGVREGLPPSRGVVEQGDEGTAHCDRLSALHRGLDAMVMVNNGRRNRTKFLAAERALRAAVEAES